MGQVNGSLVTGRRESKHLEMSALKVNKTSFPERLFDTRFHGGQQVPQPRTDEGIVRIDVAGKARNRRLTFLRHRVK